MLLEWGWGAPAEQEVNPAEPQWGFGLSLAHSSPACVGSKHPAGGHGQLPAARSAWEDNHGFLHTHLENNFHKRSQEQILLCRQGPGFLLLLLFSFYALGFSPCLLPSFVSSGCFWPPPLSFGVPV